MPIILNMLPLRPSRSKVESGYRQFLLAILEDADDLPLKKNVLQDNRSCSPLLEHAGLVLMISMVEVTTFGTL